MLALALCVVYGISDEFHQMVCSLPVCVSRMDMLANGIAASLGIGIHINNKGRCHD